MMKQVGYQKFKVIRQVMTLCAIWHSLIGAEGLTSQGKEETSIKLTLITKSLFHNLAVKICDFGTDASLFR